MSGRAALVLLALVTVARAEAPDPAAWRARCGGGDDAACLALEERAAATRDRQLATVAAEIARCGPNGCAPGSEPPIGAVAGACMSGDANACATAALRYQGGTGAPKDAAAAHRFFRLACAQGRWFDCNNLFAQYDDRLGATVSQRMFRRSCDRGDARACRDAADWLALAGGGRDESWPQEVPLYRRACDGGDGAACYTMAGHADGKERLRLLLRACDLQNPDGCFDAAHDPALKNADRKRELLQRACQAGVSDACR